MSDGNLYTGWIIGLALAGLVVLIAAALLIILLLTARSILRHAREALATAQHIEEETHVIWDLAQTNEVAGEILAATESIEAHGAQLVEAVQQPQSVLG